MIDDRGSARRVERTALNVAFVIVSAIAALAALALGGLLAGYRPVVITTGSMAPAVTTGSLLIAGPTGAVETGDILVMRRDGRDTVTHRVVELGHSVTGPYALTRGDANAEADAAPYQLTDHELVGHWVVPHAGRVLTAAGSAVGRTAIVAVAIGSFLVGRSHHSPPEPSGGAPGRP